MYLARASRWPGVGGEPVVDAFISPLSPNELVGESSTSFAAFAPSSDTGDSEEPDLLDQRYTAWLAVRVDGDRRATAPVMGGAMGLAGVLSSQGRGLLEVEAPFLESVSKLTGANGIRATCAYKGGIVTAMVDRTSWAYRQYTFACVASRRTYYAPIRRLVKSGSDLTWTIPSQRYDFLRTIVRSNDTTTPPTSPTDGAEVVVANDDDTSLVDGFTGTRSYAAFAAYDDRYDLVPAVERYYSELELGSTAVQP